MLICAVATLFFYCVSLTHLADFYSFPFYHFHYNISLESSGVKQNFVQCVGCSLVLVYKSRTGTASLLRHRCSRFPISVYDLKQTFLASTAGQQVDLLNEMATSSSNNNGNVIELKQEMLSDDEEGSYEEQDEDQQTDKGLLESFSLLEKTFMTGDELLLSREEIEIAKRNNDPDLYFER